MPEQLTTAFSLPVGLKGFASLFPPHSICAVLCVPLSISVCVYQKIIRNTSFFLSSHALILLLVFERTFLKFKCTISSEFELRDMTSVVLLLLKNV